MSAMEVDSEAPEEFVMAQTKRLRKTDPYAAKAWIITAKTLFPNSFNVQFEAYKLEKEANNCEAAAKCFSALTFQNQNDELWQEVNELTAALRAPETEITPAQEFYVKMFHHVSYEVQHKILLLAANHTENTYNQCRFLLLILKRFPQAAVTHSPRLLEMIAEGMKEQPQKYQELLVEEALPLMYHKTPELPPGLVSQLFTVSLEYYIQQMNDEEEIKCDSNECWKKIFQVLLLCGQIQRWEAFLPFNKTWGPKIYWDKLIEIVSVCPAGSTQVLFYATTLFIYSLHCYIKNCHASSHEADINHVLVEGFTEWNVDPAEGQNVEPPQISTTTATSAEISKAFVNAAQCWQLLNTDLFQRDFSKLLLALPVAPWISRFLFDLAIYFGHKEEAKKLMNEMKNKSSLVHNIQLLSLNLQQGNLTVAGFECILKILTELPTTQGQPLENLTLKANRHMLFIPLTQKALVQYCTKAVVNNLSRKLYEPNCPDIILGNLLVLLQLEYPNETLMIEQIFALITTRRSFVYRLFPAYIISIDFIEEFMHIWNSHHEDFNFDFMPSSQAPTATSLAPRRTRGADKGVREDFRMIIKQQIARANENLTTLVANFITQEHLQLMQNIFSGDEADY